MNSGEIIKNKSEALSNLKYFFTAYLHQDWDTEGGSLMEIFQNHAELQGLCPGIHSEVMSLLRSKISNEDLDEIFIDTWDSGYEPDDRMGEDWRSTLQEISNICHHYIR